MGPMFEILDIRRPGDEFMISIKDREVVDGERWVVATLSENEGAQLYDYLKQFFEKV